MVNLADAEKAYAEAQKALKTSLFKLRPEWEKALPLLESAANGFKLNKAYPQAKEAYEKIAQAQERLGSDWHAGQAYENAARMCREAGDNQDMIDCIMHAGDYYKKAGRPNYAAEAYARGAKLLEEKDFKRCIKMYREAIILMEEDDKGNLTGDMYRNAVGSAIRAQDWDVAIELLMKFAEGFQEQNNHGNLSKCYLSAIVTLLYAELPDRAWQTYQELLGVDSFCNSEEAVAAEHLFEAYASGEAGQVKKVVKQAGPFQYLECGTGRLAGKLPTGDFRSLSTRVAVLMDEGGAGLDENDLT